MATENKIGKIKEKIIKTVSPEKIIPFGSCTTGIATEESDTDLVVIGGFDLILMLHRQQGLTCFKAFTSDRKPYSCRI